MFFLHSFIGFFVSKAHAQTLNGVGRGAPGVDAMWAHICSVLPCVTGLGAGNTLVAALVNAIITFVFPLISVVAVVLVIYAGILIITSGGSEDKVGEAKKIILYACVGVVLSLMTTAIIAFAAQYFSVILS